MIAEAFRLDGAAALVTGASGGLGAAMVVAHGNARSPGDTCARIEGAGRRAVAITGDLADRSVSARLVDDAVAALGRIDILINNAGIIRRTPAAEYSDDDWDRVMEINLTSAFRLARAAGRSMLASGRGGKIVNIASLL